MSIFFFVAVFLGCTSTGRVGLCFLWFYVQELPKAQPAVVLVFKASQKTGQRLKVSSDRNPYVYLIEFNNCIIFLIKRINIHLKMQNTTL